MGQAFNTVGIIAKSNDDTVGETLAAVIRYCQQQNVAVLTDPNSKRLCGSCFEDAQIIERTALGQRCDLLICVGGDGNLLHAAHLAIEHDTPVLGVNRGRLGFLTDIKPQELDKIGEVLSGQFIHEERTLLRARIERDQKIFHEEAALNDAVLHPGKVAHMIEYKIYIDGTFVCSQRADGLIVSTPTGSTAYALSGGGPIIHPKLNALLIVPMFPHTLTNRPLVINHDVNLDIVLVDNQQEPSARFSCDGSPETNLQPGDTIKISQHPKKLKLIHPEDYDYYKNLRSKLRWATNSQ